MQSFVRSVASQQTPKSALGPLGVFGRSQVRKVYFLRFLLEFFAHLFFELAFAWGTRVSQ
jgi:hypothetical protein